MVLHHRCQTAGVERYFGGIEARLPHVDGDTAVGHQLGSDHAFFRLYANRLFAGEPLVIDKTSKTARAIAALLHLTPIGVVDDVFKIDPCCRRRAHGQDLVCPHAEVTIGQETVLVSAQAQRARSLVQHDKVVAGALHLGEADFHAVIIAVWRTSVPKRRICAMRVTPREPARFDNAPMTRTSQLLHAQREPVPARAAATVLFLRDAPDPQGAPGTTRLEVLMSRRSDKARFAANHYVFPGGSLDAEDRLHHEQLARRSTQTADALTYAQAAIRESMEEMGVLLARNTDGRWATQAEVAQIDRNQPLLPQCARLGLTLAADALWPLARWTAALEIPIRFDVPFLVARMPEGQTPVTDDAEQFEPLWCHPADALLRAAQGEMTLMFPTQTTLEHLTRYPKVQALLDVLQALPAGQMLWETLPRGGLVNGKVQRFMEHQTVYGELALVCPDGQLHHAVGWQSERPVPLLKNVMRLTADNGGTMTGPGTNTYLIGDPATGYIVVDPGPKPQGQGDPHLARIMAATGGDIRAIVCTHSHPDHSPGAAPLQALVAQAGFATPVIWGLPSAPTARAGSQFTPDRELPDGATLALRHPDGAAHSHTLRAIHTPGHAANHVCLVLEEDGLLLSGDHILNGSTTVVDPPDGNMRLYLASLQKLANACETSQVGFILPAHGYALARPLQVIQKLHAHRMAREAKVKAAMAHSPDGTPEDWVAIAYADTPQALWPVAKRSLLAHVEHIRGL